jgi:hypothetical protein
MPEYTPQTYENHRRFDPWYHYVGLSLMLAALVLALVQMFRQPGLTAVWELIISVVLAITFLRVRLYALHNQDRIIRLEETLRLERTLPEPLRARIQELTPGQFVALRFASDHELVTLVEQALTEKLGKEEIKQRIRAWRADTFRV